MQNFTGLEYLKIDIANNAGQDKLTFNERLKWFDNNIEKLLNKDEELVKEFDKPCLVLAGLNAYKDYLNKVPSGYPISLDATASGTQILACLCRDKSAAIISNVWQLEEDVRYDSYTYIYKAMCDKVGDSTKLDRKDVKQAIMTALYGSTEKPKEVFGEGVLLNTFHDTMKQYMPHLWELNTLLLKSWRSDLSNYGWVLPDGFEVNIKVEKTENYELPFKGSIISYNLKTNKPIKDGKSLSANIVHSIDGMFVREICYMASLNKQRLLKHFETPQQEECNEKVDNMYWELYLQTGFLSSRVLKDIKTLKKHFKNNKELKEKLFNIVENLPEKPFKICTIHDSFRVLPNYGNEVKWLYNYNLDKLWRSNLLNNILSQYFERDINIVSKENTNIHYEILESDYSLC